ncbi:nuclear nucleic acid-binding protein C1D-like [Argonauta hians]
MATSMNDIPKNLKEKLANLDRSLTNLEESFTPMLSKSQIEIQSEFTALEQAKLNLVAVYAMNSLFWAYLNTRGLEPLGKGVKTELDRVRTYMNRVKEIEDKAKAPKVNSDAAKRFVRNALWQSAHKKSHASSSKGVNRDTPDEEEPPMKKKKKSNKKKNKKGKHKK